MKRLSFLRNSEGSVLITTGLAILMLVGVAGMSIDLGRQQLLRARLQQSSDAAALAGATGGISATSQQTAQRYFNLNYSTSYQGVARPTPSIGVDTAVSVSASGSVPAQFVQGVNTVSTAGRSVVLPDSVNGTTQIYDLVLTMDNTGSMQTVDPGQTQSRLAGMKSASISLVNSLMGSGTTNTRVGAVAFAYQTPQTLPFTSGASSVTGFINGMAGNGGGTDTSTGMAATVPIIQGARTNVIRAVVLLTDGLNNKFQGQNSSADAPNAATINYCTQLKSTTPPTIVYTIGYGAEIMSANSSAQQLLGACATPSVMGGNNIGEHVFLVPDSAQLLQAFNSIVIDLKRMRISQ